MSPDTRGTEAFIGETIASVDATSINVLHFLCESGKVISVDAEEVHWGIPIISVTESYKEVE